MGDGNSYSLDTPVPARKGFLVSPFVGFVLLLLVLLLTVGVGVVVYFAGNRNVVCSCVLPTVSDNNVSAEKLSQVCVDRIRHDGKQICDVCGVPLTTSTSASYTSSYIVNSSSSMSSVNTTSQEPDVINYRLPTSLIPVHYELKMLANIYETDPDNFTFNGTVLISIDVMEPTRTITLHVEDFHVVENATQLLPRDGKLNIPNINFTESDDVRQFYMIHLDGELQREQKIILSMKFEGKMRNDSIGLYSTSYIDGETTVFMAVTQFAGPNARKAFPCFDEPAMKATFNLTLLRKEKTSRKYKCLSNQELLHTDSRTDGYVADVFATTPRMSTYLLAFVICDYDYIENITKSGVRYRTWASPNTIPFVQLPHYYGVHMFEWYNSHFLPKYPLQKLDNVPIPTFKFGAMENWGLITYKNNLLYRPGQTNAYTENWIAEVQSHEISHQWFGNLVSPKWFRWVWLNEGFASFWDFTVSDKIFPGFRLGDLEIVEGLYRTMIHDSLVTSHAMTYDVKSQKDIDTCYNDITYRKAAAIIRMMHDLLGEDVFLAALNRYLQKHAYEAVDQDDLFDVLTKEALRRGRDINMTDVADSWVNQKNYPLLSVRIERDGVMHVHQERFLSKKQNETVETSQYGYKWQIPITFTSSREKKFNKSRKFEDVHWLSKFETEKTINSAIIPESSESDSWLIVNLLQFGYFRVNYEESNWLALIRQLNVNCSVIASINRAQIINDAWNLASAGMLNMSIALKTLNFLRTEVDYLAWEAAWSHLVKLNNAFDRTDLYGAIRMFLKDLSQDQYAVVRKKSAVYQFPINKLFKFKMTIISCAGHNEACVEDTKVIFKEWMQHNTSIDPNLKEMVLCQGVMYSGYEEWMFVHRRMSLTLDDQHVLVGALTCSQEVWVLEKLLNMCLNSTDIDAKYRSLIILRICKNKVGRELALSFVVGHFSELLESMGAREVTHLLLSVSYYISTTSQLVQISSLIHHHDKTVVAGAKGAILTVKENIKFVEDHYATVRNWLHQSGYSNYL